MLLVDVYKQSIGDKWVKKYECNACGNVHLDSVGYIKPKGMEHQIGVVNIKCPKCKSMGHDDYVEKVRIRIEALTQQKSNIEIEIEKLTRELEEKQQKEA